MQAESRRYSNGVPALRKSARSTSPRIPTRPAEIHWLSLKAKGPILGTGVLEAAA